MRHKLDIEINEKELSNYKRRLFIAKMFNNKLEKEVDILTVAIIISNELNIDKIVSVKPLNILSLLVANNFNNVEDGIIALATPSEDILGNSIVSFKNVVIEDKVQLMEAVFVILHEFRHAIQNKLGLLNMEDYVKPTSDNSNLDSYMGQGVEVDANNFALVNHKKFYKLISKLYK